MNKNERFLEYLRGATHWNPAVVQSKLRWLDSVVQDENGCLIWKGPLQSPRAGRYPIFVHTRKARSAFSWMIEHFFPDQWQGVRGCGGHRMRSCPRTSLCVSPYHRYKGGYTGGNPTKLRDWQVRAIRASDPKEFPARRLATIHGVSPATAGKARAGFSYGWVAPQPSEEC